jgi:hypothetical protein
LDRKKKGRKERRPRARKDASWRTSTFTTACDQKSSWPPLLKFTLSFACGSLGIMLATATTSTLTSTSRWSFSFFNTRIEFRSMFIATLFLFLFLCLGQYSYFPPNTMPLFLSFPYPFAPPRSASRWLSMIFVLSPCPLYTSSLTAHTSF